ncbi:MAG: TonB-dependent receptor plug domain-containing protein, partial [Bacteroidetes bacterium]|nr:TonB-dependent receptor plug domain-containing protein [Bacteroidota bacterium]
MKLSVVLILFASLQVAAKATAQRVTFSGKDVEIQKVFSAIEEQTGHVFFYDRQDLYGLSPVSISLRDAPLDLALKTLLRDLPLDFDIQANTIFITRKLPPQKLNTVNTLAAPVDTVRGFVTDSTGAPLAGASVFIKGTHEGTVTDAKGAFVMKGVRAGSVMVISYTGFVTREFTFTYTAPVSIVLQRSQNILDAPVVQAYGTTSRRFSVGSISTVDASVIEKQPVTNVLLALQGQVPGLAMNATSGLPGSRVQLQVRGQNTLLNNPGGFKPYDQPFFIIDGVPFAPQNKNINQISNLALGTSYAGGISQSIGMSPFSTINPDDIESISVLRDADATSIYGSQGANGVVLITTKKGKAGKVNLNMSVNTGFNTAARTLHLLNTEQYLELRKQAFANDGITPQITSPFGAGYAPDLLLFDQNKYTNWQHLITGKTANTTDVHASISGGNMNTTFLVSAGYMRSEVNFPGDFANQSLTLHSNLHHTSGDNHFTIDFGTDIGYNKNNAPSYGGGQKIMLAPNLPDLMDPQGNLLWSYKGF